MSDVSKIEKLKKFMSLSGVINMICCKSVKEKNNHAIIEDECCRQAI